VESIGALRGGETVAYRTSRFFRCQQASPELLAAAMEWEAAALADAERAGLIPKLKPAKSAA